MSPAAKVPPGVLIVLVVGSKMRAVVPDRGTMYTLPSAMRTPPSPFDPAGPVRTVSSPGMMLLESLAFWSSGRTLARKASRVWTRRSPATRAPSGDTCSGTPRSSNPRNRSSRPSPAVA